MKINEFISNTKEILPEYWSSTCSQRLALQGAAGSCYEQLETIQALENELLASDWEETTHPDVMPGCRVFKAPIKGVFGLVEIASLPDDAILTADDRKNTGKVSMTVKGIRGEQTSETFMIVGFEQDKEVVFTFHPGEPVRPSVVSVANLPHGTKVTKEQALGYGFQLAKIV